MGVPSFKFFNEEWNEPPTEGDYLEDGIDDYISLPKGSGAVED